VDESKGLAGVITRTHLEHWANDPGDRLVSDVAHVTPVVAYADEPLRAVVYRMAETGLTRFPVIERGDARRLVGMISLADLLKGRRHTLDAEHRRERVAARIGYPVLVRPSYVLGGRAMEIVRNREELRRYMVWAIGAMPRGTVLVDKYLQGIEVEVDAITDGETVVIPGVMQHVERAGVHSGDSRPVSVHPVEQCRRSAKGKCVGPARQAGRGPPRRRPGQSE